MRNKVFIVGNSRSGTTMMGRILGVNKDVFTFNELHFFEQLWTPSEIDKKVEKTAAQSLFSKLACIEREGYLKGCKGNNQYIEESKEQITEELIKSDVFSKFLHYEAIENNKTIPCDQTPRNLFYCKEILDLYPDAKIIYMVRDPRDVLLSQKNKWKRRFLGAKNIPLKEALRAWINYHPVTISKLWRASVNHMKPLEARDSVRKVYFEELLQSPKEIIGEICEFIGIEYTDEMLNVPQVGSSTGGDKPKSKVIDKNKIAGYKKGGLSNVELYINESILKDSMSYHNYKPEGFLVNPLKLLYMYATFPFKIIIALLLNLNRMNNIVETIKRRLG